MASVCPSTGAACPAHSQNGRARVGAGGGCHLLQWGVQYKGVTPGKI